MKKVLVTASFLLSSCASVHTVVLKDPPPKVEPMECNPVDIGQKELVGLICRVESLEQFAVQLKALQDYADGAYSTYGEKKPKTP